MEGYQNSHISIITSQNINKSVSYQSHDSCMLFNMHTNVITGLYIHLSMPQIVKTKHEKRNIGTEV